MTSNRRGPEANCGCCKPPCTCFLAKQSFDGTYGGFISASIGTGPNLGSPCNGATTGSIAASGSVPVNWASPICGNSARWGYCPTGGEANIWDPSTINGYDFHLLGRNGGCRGPFSTFIPELHCYLTPGGELDEPCFSFDPYALLFYDTLINVYVSISFYCTGGSMGTPHFRVTIGAFYSLGILSPTPSQLTKVPATGDWTGVSFSNSWSTATRYIYTGAHSVSHAEVQVVTNGGRSVRCGPSFGSTYVYPGTCRIDITGDEDDPAPTPPPGIPFDPYGLFASVLGGFS